MKRIFSMAMRISLVLSLLTVFVPGAAGAEDILLGITWQDSLLVSFNPYTGEITDVHAQLNPNEAFRGLAYDSNHNLLYALSQVGRNLYVIDPITLNIQHIGNLHIPCGNFDIGGLTFNPSEDRFYSTLIGINGNSTDLIIVDVDTAEVSRLGHITQGYCFSPSYNANDGKIYGFVLSETGDWESPYKSNLFSINPDDMAMATLFETPYHTILGLAKKHDENIFYSWVNWTSHFYGEINPDAERILSLADSDPVGVASDAMIDKTFVVGTGSLLPTVKNIVTFDFIAHVTKIWDPENFLGGKIKIGDKFSGQFFYDINLLYLETAEQSLNEISIEIGGLSFSFNDLRVGMANNFYDCYSNSTYDSFYLNSESWDDVYDYLSFNMTLKDHSSTSLSNNVFLPDKFNLASWDENEFNLLSTASGDLSGFSIYGVMDEIISDVDSDGDGTPDYSDNCPNDPNKIKPGGCGCGVADSDSDRDSDGTLDCKDDCPDDPQKIRPGGCGCGIPDLDSDSDGTPDCIDLNDDNDGVPDEEEYGPEGNDPNYDGNNDGTADALQDNVVSFHTFDGQHYLIITAPAGASISSCKVSGNSSSVLPPSKVDFVYGFFEMAIENVDIGGAAEITLYLPSGETFDTYYKYGLTPEHTINHWYQFLYNGQTGAEIHENVITLHFVDGMRGDDDLILNGKITDIGGPGISLRAGGGGGNCFIATTVR